MSKPAKIKISVIQKNLWEECKRIIHKRYKNVCYTCGATGLFGRNFQTGHMIAKGYLNPYLKYDLRLLRPQCMRCNIHFGGMGALFIENMRRIEGDDFVNQILKDLEIEVEQYDHYLELLEKYVIIKR